MSGSGGDGRDEMSDDERKAYAARVSELSQRLDRAQASGRKPAAVPDEARRHRASGQAIQMALDLVLGPAVGAGIGWGLDRVLGTSPWLLLVFLGLGFAAGVTNLIRTYRQIMAESGSNFGKDLPAGRNGDDDD